MLPAFQPVNKFSSFFFISFDLKKIVQGSFLRKCKILSSVFLSPSLFLSLSLLLEKNTLPVSDIP